MLTKRAEAVQLSLRRERIRGSSSEVFDLFHIATKVPSALGPLIALRRRKFLRAAKARRAAQFHAVLSSVNVGGGASLNLQLLGSPLAFCGMFPPLLSYTALTHALIGAGDQLTLSVMTSPAIIPDLDLYLELLTDAVEEVTEEMATRI